MPAHVQNSSLHVTSHYSSASDFHTKEILILKLFTPCILNQCSVFMYWINALTIYDITVTSLQHVSAWQCHLQGVHSKLKIIYSILNRITFMNFITIRIAVIVWIYTSGLIFNYILYVSNILYLRLMWLIHNVCNTLKNAHILSTY